MRVGQTFRERTLIVAKIVKTLSTFHETRSSITVSLIPCKTFRNMLIFMVGKLLFSYWRNLRFVDHLLSDSHSCLRNTFAATLQTCRSYPPLNIGRLMP